MTATMTPPDQTQTPNNEPPKNKSKSLPSPVKAVLRPILFLAIAAHGLLLIAPLPSSNTLEIPDEKETQIKITQLPPAKPSPKLSQQENKASDAASATDDTATGSDDSASTSDSSGSIASTSSDFSYASDDSSSSASSYSSSRSSAGIGTGIKTYSGSFADFPHYKPSESGRCYGMPDCWTVKGASLDLVDKHFAQALKDKDFGVTPDKNEKDFRIYLLRGGLEERYLSMIVDGQNILYLVSSRPIEGLAALKEAGEIFITPPTTTTTTPTNGQPSTTTPTTTTGQTSIDISANSTSTEPLVEVPEELYTLLDELIPALPLPDKLPDEYSDAKPAYFAQPNLFFKLPTVTSPAQQANVEPTVSTDDIQPLPGMEKAVYLLDIAPDKFYTESLSEKLSQLFEAVKEVGEFSGGKLYELKQEKKPTLYLNLLPLQKHPSGKTGTIVVLWSRDPRPPASSITGTPIAVPTPSASPTN